jgi:hypothetical protein
MELHQLLRHHALRLNHFNQRIRSGFQECAREFHLATCSPTLWDRFTAWLGSSAMAEQSVQNAQLPQAYCPQSFYCPNTQTTITTASPEQGVEETQSQYTAINNCTVNTIGNGIAWFLKLLETYFILVVIILAIALFLYVAVKE